MSIPNNKITDEYIINNNNVATSDEDNDNVIIDIKNHINLNFDESIVDDLSNKNLDDNDYIDNDYIDNDDNTDLV